MTTSRFNSTKIPVTLKNSVTAWNKANKQHQKLAREINTGLKHNGNKPAPKSLMAKIERYQKQTTNLTQRKKKIVHEAQKRGLSVKQKQNT